MALPTAPPAKYSNAPAWCDRAACAVESIPDSTAFAACQDCNELWSADFKGDFALSNRQRCYPLTMTDNFSRYLLQCQALAHPTTEAVQPWMEWAFREYGLPDCIRTDNGAPFASLAWAASAHCSSGGSGSVSVPNASARASRAKTGAMSACTAV